MEKAGITPREGIGHYRKVSRERHRREQRRAGIGDDCRNAEQAAAISIAALLVRFGMIVRLRGVVMSSGFSAMMVHRSITVRMRRHVCLCLVDVCRRLTVSQAMRGAPQRDRGVGHDQAESVKRGSNKCGPRTQSLAQSRKHHRTATAPEFRLAWLVERASVTPRLSLTRMLHARHVMLHSTRTAHTARHHCHILAARAHAGLLRLLRWLVGHRIVSNVLPIPHIIPPDIPPDACACC